MSDIRVRFAPSPTGYLHVGGLRTALFNYLFAKANGGKIILRFEDTDQARKVEGAEENLLSSMEWAGLTFDEGPTQGGDYGPYVQSERLDLYRTHVEKLVEDGNAYPCFCTVEDLDAMREDQIKRKQPTRYDGRCRRLKPEEREAKLSNGDDHVIRMKIIHSKGDYKVSDMVRGTVIFKPNQIDDQVILKTDGFPTYHLASVVDDHLMKITHVIRGEEWLPSTPKHIQLYEYFGWEIPQFSHLPLLLNADRSKLSKRQGDVATEDYRNKGFLPEALINFVALLGWNPGDEREIFSMEELIAEFSTERIGKAGSVFDQQKLLWMNQKYIQKLPLEELMALLQPHLPEAAKSLEPKTLEQMVSLVQEGLNLLSEIEKPLELFLNQSPELTEDSLKEIIQGAEPQTVFKAFLEVSEAVETFTAESFFPIMKAVQKKTGIKGKSLWIPMRIAITLTEHGPELANVVEIFGKEKCIKMIKSQIVS
ncbi:MAG: glutamate--tRNA ligase [SAR324 cluster bacterium]|nr:glutamate--tRNA ligase [SAR324 cluster bacterium]